VCGAGLRDPIPKLFLPLAPRVMFIAGWHITCEMLSYEISRRTDCRLIELFRRPGETLVGMKQPVLDGRCCRFAVASIYRVAMGFGPRL